MKPEAKGRFFKLLGDVMAGYGKAMDPATMETWFNKLAPFEPAVIRAAFDAYEAERPDFAPVPNSIAARCRLLDGRPDENEAWAVALGSRDESETVCWTDEMQEAFNLCKPVLNGGDEIGARMAFKDAYNRLVAAARAANRPAKWTVSEGWDKTGRQKVIEQATRAGLLAAPPTHLALPDESGLPPAKPEGLQRLKEVMGTLEDPITKAARHREERLAAEDEADRVRKAAVDEKVKAYFEAHPEARYQGLLKGKGPK